MADITNLFKATVKAVRSRQKAQNKQKDAEKNHQQHHIFPTSRQKSEFSQKAKDLVGNISKLRDFLMEHRKNYVNAGNHLTNESNHMTDDERDRIDLDAQTFIQTCQETIRILRMEAFNNKISSQMKEHREAMFDLIQTYLKGICKIYSEQRAIRVKRAVDKKRISRLEPVEKKVRHSRSVEPSDSSTSVDSDTTNSSLKNVDPIKTASPSIITPPVKERPPAPKFIPTTFGEEEDELSPEEINAFEQENQQVYHEMNSIVDEVRQIEGKVVEISRLQEIFADKVLEQEGDINRIADTAVGTTENIKEGNEEIREAMKNNASFRVWILFFLVVLSFTLLFLDWYNG
ncbi:syntaxin-18-like [Tubulanus polymorphus]|uniref:syntaxin-18-like n=1 Tax=Tubulanus polymorphus TaxID=672921 RepID=UPI003DA2F7B6